MKYKVFVSRTTSAEHVFIVNLPHDKNEADAEQAAIEAAYNFDWNQFTTPNAEYEVDLIKSADEEANYVIGEKAIFFSDLEDDECGLRARNGQACIIIAIYSEADADHDPEYLPMYGIRFDDGKEIQAYPEELHGGTQ